VTSLPRQVNVRVEVRRRLVGLDRLPLSLCPGDRQLARWEGVRKAHIDRIEELRLDAVRAVVAELDAPRRVRALDMKLEQEFAGLRLPRRRRRVIPEQRFWVQGPSFWQKRVTGQV
jgi:hypothetical protein